jgi:hypothetical protein
MSDFDNYGNAAMTPAGYPLEKMARAPTLQERLDMAVESAEERLAAVKEAREIFTRNPDLEKLLNVMQRGLF